MHDIKASWGRGDTFRSFLLLNDAVRLLDCTDCSFLTSAFDGGNYSENNFIYISVNRKFLPYSLSGIWYNFFLNNY